MKAFLICILMAYGLAVSAQSRQINEKINIDGIQREFITYLPDGDSNLPVIIALHGNLGTAKGMFRLADFRPIADKEHFIVVCPQGVSRSWNDGRATKANKAGINDVKFIDLLITYIINMYHADGKRIYVTGMSNGGFMTSRLACELSNRIAAGAVVAASMNADASYQPVNPIPMMYIQGTEDPLVPYNGGMMTKGACGEIYSHAQALEIWAKADNCNTQPVLTTTPDNVHDGTTVTKAVYTNPSTGMQVVGYTIVNGGHTWPGGWQYFPKAFIGISSKNLNACQAIWNFFKTCQLK